MTSLYLSVFLYPRFPIFSYDQVIRISFYGFIDVLLNWKIFLVISESRNSWVLEERLFFCLFLACVSKLLVWPKGNGKLRRVQLSFFSLCLVFKLCLDNKSCNSKILGHLHSSDSWGSRPDLFSPRRVLERETC